VLKLHKNILIKIFVHILIWALIAFILFRYPPNAHRIIDIPKDFIIKQIAHFIFMVSAFYANAYYFVPRLFLKNKFLYFALAIISFLLIASFTMATIDEWLDLATKLEGSFGKRRWQNPYIDTFALFTTLFVLGISTSVALIQKWAVDQKKMQEFENQQTKTELSFLKAQINPHFFFNTLNSIYALTFLNVETSQKLLCQLSRMMRYVLYETQQDKTVLSRELDFIQDYVEIMKLRLNTNTEVLFTLPNEVGDAAIAPMILLPFVENAFKHGVDDVAKTTITISISTTGRKLELDIRNTIVGQTGGLYEDTNSSGIGLVNTKRRLDLLYHDRYTLKAAALPTNTYHLNLHLSL
jgi:two-component system LytT family sensor kinase